MIAPSTSRRLFSAMITIGMLLVFVAMMFPLYWMVVTSLKKEIEIFKVPPTLFPQVLNTDSYSAQIQHGDFNMFRSFRNSFLISIGAMLISLTLAIPASYGVGRFAFKGKRLFILSFLVTQMLPVSVLLTPMFITFRNLHVLNTPVSAILADATIGIPFSVLILMGYFASIPRELTDASRIDGCNQFRAFRSVFLPIASPGVVVCLVFSFLYGWGDLAFGMTFILDQTLRPITAGMFNFLGQYGTKWSYLTAFAVVTTIPVVLVFIFMQKYIISGLTAGAVKG
jgi:multiple sugar transport system permease protein